MNTAKCRKSPMYTSQARFSDCRDHVGQKDRERQRKRWEGTMRAREGAGEVCLGEVGHWHLMCQEHKLAQQHLRSVPSVAGYPTSRGACWCSTNYTSDWPTPWKPSMIPRSLTLARSPEPGLEALGISLNDHDPKGKSQPLTKVD